MSYRWSFTVFTQSAVGAFYSAADWRRNGGSRAAAWSYRSVLDDVPVWAWRHCRHLSTSGNRCAR